MRRGLGEEGGEGGGGNLCVVGGGADRWHGLLCPAPPLSCSCRASSPTMGAPSCMEGPTCTVAQLMVELVDHYQHPVTLRLAAATLLSSP